MGLFGKDPDFQPVYDNINRNRGMYESIGLPEYTDFVPELYNTESVNYDLIDEDPVLRSQQVSALEKLAGLSSDGLSAEDQAAFFKARNMANRTARQGTEAAMANANARGIGGSGLEFAMRETANQEAATRAQEAAMEQAAASARNRALYTQAYGDQLAKVRGQDMNAESANTDIINKFNMSNTAQRNAVNMANVGQRNDAFKYNEGLKDKRYQNQMDRTDRIAGMSNEMTRARMGEADQNARQRQADINTFMGIAGMGVNAMGAYNAGKKRDEEF